MTLIARSCRQVRLWKNALASLSNATTTRNKHPVCLDWVGNTASAKEQLLVGHATVGETDCLLNLSAGRLQEGCGFVVSLTRCGPSFAVRDAASHDHTACLLPNKRWYGTISYPSLGEADKKVKLGRQPKAEHETPWIRMTAIAQWQSFVAACP